MTPLYSIVLPVYKNDDSIPQLLRELGHLHEELHGTLEAVFVVDGSPDQSLNSLAALLPTQPYNSKLIALSRNFGSFAAIRAGLERASGKYFAVMAADLQEPPELTRKFFSILNSDEADVVVGTRLTREDPYWSGLFAKLYWYLYRRFIQPETPEGGIDVFACNEAFRQHLLRLKESHSSMVGLILWLGFRRCAVPYHRRKRPHGRSAWTLKKKLKYLSDSAFSFSNAPIRALLWIGFLGVTASLLFAVVVVWARLTGHIQVPGYSPVVLAIVFFGSINVVCLGIVGSYVWRTFENTKLRPGSVMMSEIVYGQKGTHESLHSSPGDL